jgi:hypothetical protein
MYESKEARTKIQQRQIEKLHTITTNATMIYATTTTTTTSDKVTTNVITTNIIIANYNGGKYGYN